MPDTFRALHLTAEHVGRRVRVREGEGRLSALHHIDDTLVQLLLVDDDGPTLVLVGAGSPVELDPPLDCPPV